MAGEKGWVKEIRFRNFKLLHDTTLPLDRFTLIVGPNNSGRSTALQAISLAVRCSGELGSRIVTAWAPRNSDVEVEIRGDGPYEGKSIKTVWDPPNYSPRQEYSDENFLKILRRFTIYSLDANSIAQPALLTPRAELGSNGAGLVTALDRLRDEEPERFEALNEELGRWLPEFDRILFETLTGGMRGLMLRTREGHHAIRAADLSQGTLLALTLLTLAYLPDPPSVIGIEEPDRGLHPRLLREVKDALYRLSYPEAYGEKHSPVQVIATTHSPYFLDLFRDNPEEVVIAERSPSGVQFQRLSEHPHLYEILGEASLGEVWYTGVLGGVPPTP